MEITLEKIELVKDRTGVSYKEAKDALQATDGSVVDAIINIEESIDFKQKKSFSERGNSLVDGIKELVKKGNVAKILVKDKEGGTILSLPVNAGIVATVIAPWGVLAGIIASFGFRCVVEVVKDDGTVIDVSDRANDAVGKAVVKSSEFADVAKQKGNEVYEKVTNSETYEKVKDKADVAKQKSNEVYDKVTNSETYEKVKDKAEDTFEKTSDVIKNKMKKSDEEEEATPEEVSQDKE